MTEAEWLTGLDVLAMLERLQSHTYTRKHRLFAVACCRRIDGVMTDKGRTAVTAAERFADTFITDRELHAAWSGVGFPKADVRRFAAGAARGASASPTYNGAAHTAASAVNAAIRRVDHHLFDQTRMAEHAAQADLLRDIFGNPFQPVVFDPRWRSETAVALASAIYEERAFDRMPILADALEEAGCDHADVLGHCRGPGPHVRGCWAVDGVLGRS